MTDRDLIKEFVRRGLVDQSTADRALKESSYTRRPAEEILYEKRLLDEVAAAKVKGEVLAAPYRKVDAETIGEDLLSLIPRETSITYRVIPLERRGSMLVVGMLHPDDERAREALKFIAKQAEVSLGVYLVTPSDLAAVWKRYASYRSEVEAAVREIGDIASEEGRLVALDEGGSSDEAPVIKIVASTLRQAVEAGASDVHIEPQRSRLRIRFRIDGDLQEVVALPIGLSQPIISRVKVLARMKLDENRIPQDGRFRTAILDREIDYRVATFPTPVGEKVAIRVLDPATGLRDFNQLGLSAYNLRRLEDAIGRPYGMILLSGPTGSGKTTTLYAIMRRLSSDQVNVVSLEDPVEYTMEGINQSQVKPEIGYDFGSGLRQILRQDPDVVMVGEIRDVETAGLAVNAALTGHIMLSTLHTNNAIGVIPRLIDLGVPPFLISSSLNLMVAQRLVLRLCRLCRKASVAPPEIQRLIGQALAALPADIRRGVEHREPYRIYHAEPVATCKECRGKGSAGRVGIYEIFRMTRELGDLINTGFSEGKLWDEARRQGMVTLRQDGVLKALEGEITMEEVMRETAEATYETT